MNDDYNATDAQEGFNADLLTALYTHLPPETTLDEMEQIKMKMFTSFCTWQNVKAEMATTDRA